VQGSWEVGIVVDFVVVVEEEDDDDAAAAFSGEVLVFCDFP